MLSCGGLDRKALVLLPEAWRDVDIQVLRYVVLMCRSLGRALYREAAGVVIAPIVGRVARVLRRFRCKS